MKKESSKDKLKEKIKSKKIPKRKSKEKEEKNTKDIIPEIDTDIEEEKQMIPNTQKGEFSDISSFEVSEVNLDQSKSSVSLNKINRLREKPFDLEEFLENSPLNKEKFAWQEEFNPMNYSTIEKKAEQKYHTIGQEYGALQKEVLMNNPHFVVKDSPFVDLNKTNVLKDTFQKQKFNPFADATLRGQDKGNENYSVNSNLGQMDVRLDNPFENQDKKYKKPLS